MKLSMPQFSEALVFRFFADFDIKIEPKETAKFTERQAALLRAITASPNVLREMARMSLETDLAGLSGQHLSGLFSGPDTDEILECVLPCLDEQEKDYWKGLRGSSGDKLHFEIMPVFMAFDAKLRRAGVRETGSEIKSETKAVGPTLDARTG